MGKIIHLSLAFAATLTDGLWFSKPSEKIVSVPTMIDINSYRDLCNSIYLTERSYIVVCVVDKKINDGLQPSMKPDTQNTLSRFQILTLLDNKCKIYATNESPDGRNYDSDMKICKNLRHELLMAIVEQQSHGSCSKENHRNLCQAILDGQTTYKVKNSWDDYFGQKRNAYQNGLNIYL